MGISTKKKGKKEINEEFESKTYDNTSLYDAWIDKSFVLNVLGLLKCIVFIITPIVVD